MVLRTICLSLSCNVLHSFNILCLALSRHCTSSPFPAALFILTCPCVLFCLSFSLFCRAKSPSQTKQDKSQWVITVFVCVQMQKPSINATDKEERKKGVMFVVVMHLCVYICVFVLYKLTFLWGCEAWPQIIIITIVIKTLRASKRATGAYSDNVSSGGSETRQHTWRGRG